MKIHGKPTLFLSKRDYPRFLIMSPRPIDKIRLVPTTHVSFYKGWQWIDCALWFLEDLTFVAVSFPRYLTTFRFCFELAQMASWTACAPEKTHIIEHNHNSHNHNHNHNSRNQSIIICFKPPNSRCDLDEFWSVLLVCILFQRRVETMKNITPKIKFKELMFYHRLNILSLL